MTPSIMRLVLRFTWSGRKFRSKKKDGQVLGCDGLALPDGIGGTPSCSNSLMSVNGLTVSSVSTMVGKPGRSWARQLVAFLVALGRGHCVRHRGLLCT